MPLPSQIPLPLQDRSRDRPPVISAIRPSSFPICFSFNSPPLDSTASRKSWCAHRVVSKHTLSDRILRVLYGPPGSKPKNGITNGLEGASVEFGEFSRVALLRRG